MTDYIALIHKEPGSDYGVSFPDFPGCVTAGRTLDEAKREAFDALALQLVPRTHCVTVPAASPPDRSRPGYPPEVSR